MTDLEFTATEEMEPRRGRGAKAHTVINIILAVLATVAFFFVALYTVVAVDSYIGMKGFDGEGINGAGLGFAFSVVFVLVASIFSAPLSLAGVISSGIAMKKRTDGARKTAVVTFTVSLVYIILNIAAVAALLILTAI